MGSMISQRQSPHFFYVQCNAYFSLCKPRVVALMIFTAWVGMLLATDHFFPWKNFLLGSTGIAFMAGAAASLNHIVDRHIDALMRRTEARPLPQGKLSVGHSLTFSAIIGVSGFTILYLWVNTLTAWLTLTSLIGYAVIYTTYLKRTTPQNIVIGGLSGAMPPILGWTAITAEIHPYALILALIIFVWTPPHFWSLAIYRKEDYAKVDIPMLPVTHGEDFTRLHILFYTILMIAVTLLPYAVGMSGLFYLVGALLLDAGFLYHAILLYVSKNRDIAIKTFVFSIVYLFSLFAFLLLDRFLPLWGNIFSLV